MSVPLPENEAARLNRLRSYDILDTSQEQTYDDITQLAAYICDTPISLVSLLDETRQWFKSAVGLNVTETPREQAFCSHAILEDKVLVVPNALEDARFAANPLVTDDPHIRFYAGAPLITPSGHALGTLCVIDRVPRTLTLKQEEALRSLSRQVVGQLELRRALQEKERTEEELRETTILQQGILDSAAYSLISTDVQGTIQTFNRAAGRMLGYSAQEIVGKVTPAILHDADEVAKRAECLTQELGRSISPGFEVFTAKIKKDIPDEHEWTYIRKDGSRFPVSLSTTALRDAAGDVTGYLGIAQDITTRKQVEKTLHDSEKKLTLAQQVAQMGSWEYDLVTGKVTWSSELFRLFDLDPQLGEPDYAAAIALYHPDDAALLDTCVRQATVEGKDYALDLRQAVAPGQSFRWYHAVGRAERNTSGQVACLVGTLTDITERKQMEEALQRANDELEMRVLKRTAALQDSEKQLRATFEQAAVGIAHIALNGAWINVNNKLCEIVGYSRQELSMLTFQDITHPDDLNTDMAYVAQVVAGDIATYSIEKRYIRKDRSLVWINLTVALVRDLDGDPRYFVSIIEDISVRKKAQEALRESEVRYRFLADAMPQLVWTALPDGYVDYYNQRWYDYTGMTCQELLGWGWQPVLHPDDLQNCLARWTHSFTTGEPYEVEYRFKQASDGLYRWQLGRALPRRNEAGEIVQWVGTCTDIDDYKQAQVALRRMNEDLEDRVTKRTADLIRSNEELRQFAYVASHDLQEPLRMVGSYTQLLARRYQGQLDDKADTYIAYAVDGVTRMQALIRDLLAYSRIGMQETPLQQTSVNKVVDLALLNLKVALEESAATVTVDPLPTVMAEETQLASLLQNLIGNGLKYHGDEPPCIHISAEPQGQEWRFAVKDNGIGIDPQFSERIFVIFQRLHEREAYSGTGIGLAICKKIVERHQGRIWMESEPGKAPTFFFTLPKSEKKALR